MGDDDLIFSDRFERLDEITKQANRQRTVFREFFGHASTQSAHDGMFFRGNDAMNTSANFN